jgi:DNA polymerase zeta
MRVRLDNIDYALARPGPLDDSTLPRVPVIRIYGLSSGGQRACLHVHQVYPYFFVDYHGSLNPDRGTNPFSTSDRTHVKF